MDFLKYLDILIGLAVVMVMLSPVVTAFTQVLMWARNHRSRFLQEGLKNLILHIEGVPAARMRVVDAHGNPAAAAKISFNGTGGAKTPADDLQVPEVLGQSTWKEGSATVEITDGANQPLADHKVILTVFPSATRAGETLTTAATAADGKATFAYAHAGSAAYTSSHATVTVLDPAGATVAAGPKIICTVKTGPDAGKSCTILSGVFDYPGASVPVPPDYDMECEVKDALGSPLKDYKLRFAFDRYSRCDRDEPASAPTNARGRTTIKLPSSLADSVARAIAEAVLLHPMIAKVAIRYFRDRRNLKGEVIQREEFTRILLELAANEGAGGSRLSDDLRQRLRRVLELNGVPNPAQALADIRAEAQNREENNPDTAAHLRQATAILAAAKSDYVGKINGWFDQTMDRVTQKYTLQARAFTMVGAFVVAMTLQVNSVDLLRRLSTDDKLRASLLAEGKAQQDRIDKLLAQPPAGQSGSVAPAKGNSDTTDDIQLAKARRDEIDTTLAKLREPGLAILPDHFVWQKVPQARLVRNPLWKAPYPAKFELLLGQQSYVITPRWRRDPMKELKAAIDDAKAPVGTMFEPGEQEVLIEANQASRVRLLDDNVDLLSPAVEMAQARLRFNDDWMGPFQYTARNPMQLIIDDRPAAEIVVDGDKDHIIDNLNKELAKESGVAVRKDGKDLILTARDPRVHFLGLLWRKNDSFTNVLDNPEPVTRAGLVAAKSLGERKGKTLKLEVDGTATDVAVEALQHAQRDKAIPPSVSVTAYSTDALVLRSKRLGPIELRYTAGKGETNILNAAVDSTYREVLSSVFEPGILGVLLTWVLLSLGAPFWYDTLKDLLKLRPALAGKEEQQRNDRQAEAPPEKGKTKDKDKDKSK